MGHGTGCTSRAPVRPMPCMTTSLLDMRLRQKGSVIMPMLPHIFKTVCDHVSLLWTSLSAKGSGTDCISHALARPYPLMSRHHVPQKLEQTVPPCICLSSCLTLCLRCMSLSRVPFCTLCWLSNFCTRVARRYLVTQYNTNSDRHCIVGSVASQREEQSNAVRVKPR